AAPVRGPRRPTRAPRLGAPALLAAPPAGRLGARTSSGDRRGVHPPLRARPGRGERAAPGRHGRGPRPRLRGGAALLGPRPRVPRAARLRRPAFPRLPRGPGGPAGRRGAPDPARAPRGRGPAPRLVRASLARGAPLVPPPGAHARDLAVLPPPQPD